MRPHVRLVQCALFTGWLCFSLLMLSASATRVSAQTSWNVSSADNAYQFKLGSTPVAAPTTLVRGTTYQFVVAVESMHPFWIKHSLGGQGNGAYLNATPNGQTNATIVVTIPLNTAGPLYFQCGNHYGMNGTFTLVDPPPAGNGAACTTNGHCISGYCSPTSVCAAPPLLPNNSACTANAQCVSNLCLSTNVCGATNLANGASCQVAAQCQAGTCNGGKCGKAKGTACGGNTQCASNACVNGYCCLTSCAAPANVCQLPACAATTGVCTTISNPNTNTTCNDNKSCTVNDHCSGSGSCVGTVSCSDPIAANCADVTSGACNSAGACGYSGIPTQPQICRPSGADPSVSYSCQDGACVAENTVGTAFGWGGTYNGTGVQSATPTLITDDGRSLTLLQTASGYQHSVALAADGSVWTWGDNGSGQLGDGTREASSTPVNVTGLGRLAIAVAAGRSTSYAVLVDGSVRAWGANDKRQLGDPTFAASYSPTPRTAPGYYDTLAITAGDSHVIVLRADGTLSAWGDNTNGQLGNGATSTTPTASAGAVAAPTTGAVRYKSIVAGSHHTLALATNGQVFAWGRSGYGAVGGTTNNVLRPTAVAGLLSARAIAAGGSHSLAIDYAGAVWAWGNNTDGTLGNGTVDYLPHTTPARVSRINGAIAIAAGLYNCAAVLADGSLWTWGSNSYGQLGDPARMDPTGYPVDPTPQPIASVTDAQSVSLGAWHAVLVRPLNAIKTWGQNSNGLLGNGNSANQQVDAVFAVDVRLPDAVQTVRAISASGCNSHSMLLAGDGSVWSWGDNSFGELGVIGGHATDPVRVTNLPPVMAIAAGCYTSAALAADGTVWTWGFGGYGTLGNGAAANLPLPAKLTSISAVSEIAMRGLSMSVLRTTGRVYTWGYNAYGELGVAASAPRATVPSAYVSMPAGRLARSIAQGYYNGFAILDNGTLAGWGNNASGMLGVGGNNVSYLPTLVGASSSNPILNVAAVSPGANSTLAIGSSRRAVLGWGSAHNQELGDLTPGPYNTPRTMGTLGKVVSSGSYVNAVIHNEGSVRLVGSGVSGSLGNGDRLPRTAWTPATGVINASAVVTGLAFNMAIVPGPARQRQYAIVQCAPKVALVAPTGTAGNGNTCSVRAPTGVAIGVLLRGDVLAPDRVYRRGEVLVDATGTIACVGCDCSTTPNYAHATRIDCPNAAISPGLINTHEHLSCRSLDATPARFEVAPYGFRDDWATRVEDPDGFPNLNYICNDISDAELVAAETRHIISGTTSVVGHGFSTGAGLLRNLDVIDYTAMKQAGRDRREGLRARVMSNTFPLDNRFAPVPAGSACVGGAPVHVHGADAELMHLGEGIDGRADRELTCAIGGATNGVYPDQTTVVHAITLRPEQAKTLRDNRAWVSWSPRSNIDLYGDTTPVVMLDQMGVGIALGTDWSVTGSISLNRELACAASYNQTYLDNYFSDYRLWQMVTSNAASAVGVERSVGQLRAGTMADIAIFDGSGASLHSAVVRADTRSVAMTMRGGDVIYGDSILFTSSASPWYLKRSICGGISVCGLTKRMCAPVTAYNPYLAYCGSGVEPSCVPRRPGYGPSTSTDRDGDGWPDGDDNCPNVFNPGRAIDGNFQPDSEPTGADGIGDACDPCPLTAGSTCAKLDANDVDADGIPNAADTCPGVDDGPTDSDGDGVADACDCSQTWCFVDVALTHDQEALGYIRDDNYVVLLDMYVTAILPGHGYFAQADARRLPAPRSGRTWDPTDFGNYGNLGIYVATNGTPMADDWGTGTTEPIVVGNRVAAFGGLSGQNGMRTLIAHGAIFQDRGTTLPFTALERYGTDLSTYGGSGTTVTGMLAEQFESTWMRVTNMRLTDAYPDGPTSSSNEFKVLYSGYNPAQWSSLRIDDYLTNYSAQLPLYRTPNQTFSSISGVLIYSAGNHKLAPRSVSEIVTP